MIPLSLFSSVFSITEKKKESQKNFYCVIQLNQWFVLLPVLVQNLENLTFFSNVDKSTSLSELITKDSCSFFHFMQIDSSFLLENLASWQSLNSYQSGLKTLVR